MTPEREKEIRDICDHLRGTCDHDPEDHIDTWTPEELALFDEFIFRCTACGWWCSQDENNEDDNGEWVCDDCYADTHEEDQ